MILQAGIFPAFFCACSCPGASRAGLRGRRRSVVLRDAGSIPPGLPGCSWFLAPQRAARREQVGQRNGSIASPRCCSPLLAKAVACHAPAALSAIRRLLKPSSGQSEASAPAVDRTRLVLVVSAYWMRFCFPGRRRPKAKRPRQRLGRVI